jgi:hypothetical protein
VAADATRDGKSGAGPNALVAWMSLVVALAAAVSGAAIFLLTDPDLHLNVDSFAVLAPVYFAAQAIERLLEPLASFINPTAPLKETVRQAREEKLRCQQEMLAAGARRHTLMERMQSAVHHEQEALRSLGSARANRKLVWFMVATVVSCLLAGVLGLGVLQAMADRRLEPYLGAVDVALTGLAIGAGTKPLHDLIEHLQKSKENADPATRPAMPPA